jgi:hypothetical protein
MPGTEPVHASTAPSLQATRSSTVDPSHTSTHCSDPSRCTPRSAWHSDGLDGLDAISVRSRDD